MGDSDTSEEMSGERLASRAGWTDTMEKKVGKGNDVTHPVGFGGPGTDNAASQGVPAPAHPHPAGRQPRAAGAGGAKLLCRRPENEKGVHLPTQGAESSFSRTLTATQSS